MQTVAEIKQSARDQKVSFELVLLVKKTQMKRAKNNSEFLMVELGDRTGMFHLVCFENSANFSFFQEQGEGKVVRVRGNTDHYQGRFSPNIAQVEIVRDEEMGRYLENLVETAPIPLDALWKETQEHIEAIENPALRETVRLALDELDGRFQITPGAISMHHAYRGGLMEHTVRMARACRALLPLYPEVHADLALAGILLHDIGKALEYTPSLATTRSQSGILQGHVVLGYRQVRRAALQSKLGEPLLERLEHIILSHQGELEWGAAAKAATPEAVFVSMVDNLDAKMGMVQYALRSTPADEEFSEFVAGLGAPLLTRSAQ
jgi:3'-5' exoribonuclease